MANDLNLEAAEWLFRVRHTISHVYPKVDSYSPTIIQLHTLANTLDCWLLARLATDPRQRQTLGWMAVYWLLENIWVAPRLFEDSWRFFHSFNMLCGFIAEFGLWGEEQGEFERMMKLFISLSGKTQARRMLAEPTPPPTLQELGGISGAQAVAVYRRIAQKHGKYPPPEKA